MLVGEQPTHPARGSRTPWRVRDPPDAPAQQCRPRCPVPLLGRVPSRVPGPAQEQGCAAAPGSALCPFPACPGRDPSCSHVMPTCRLAPVPVPSPRPVGSLQVEADVGSELCHSSARDVSPGRVPGDRAELWYWWLRTAPGPWHRALGPVGAVCGCPALGHSWGRHRPGGPCAASPSPRWERGVRRVLPGATR